VADVEEKDPNDTLDQTLPNDSDQSEATESDSYWNFLEDDEFQYKLSNTELFQEWQDSAPRDRFTEEFSLARYPKQGVAGSGPFAVPEWFPKSYIAYANTFDPYMSNRLQETVFPSFGNVTEEYLDDLTGLDSSVGDFLIIGITPPDILAASTDIEKLWNPETQAFEPNPNYNPDVGGYDNIYDLYINDKTYLRDTNQIGTLSGESLADQDWFDESKQEVLRKFVENQSHPNFDDNYLDDTASIGKAITWGEFRKALAKGVDPDKVFAELEKLSELPHEKFAEGPLVDTAQNLVVERFKETRDVFYSELNDFRENDGTAFVETYAYLPVQDKLRYLNSLYDSKEISKEEYEGLFVQEINALYNPEFTPNNLKFVEINDKFYLDTSGSQETKEYHLYDADNQFYGDYDDYEFFSQLGGTKGGPTDDFDPSGWDFLDPIVSVVSMFAPVVGAIYTGVKALSGEGLNTGDWLRALPGIAQGIEMGAEAAGFPEFKTTTTLGDLFPVFNDTIIGSTTVGIPTGGAGNVAAQAGSILAGEGGIFKEIGEIIVAADTVSKLPKDQTSDTDINGNGVSDFEEGIIVNFRGAMEDEGIYLPEGVFSVSDDGQFVGVDGNPISFITAIQQATEIFRKEKPRAFADMVINTPEEYAPTLKDFIGAAYYNLAVSLIADDDWDGDEEGQASFFSEIAREGFLQAAQSVAEMANGLLEAENLYFENAEFARYAEHINKLAESGRSPEIAESMKAFDEYMSSYIDVDTITVPTKKETIEEIKETNFLNILLATDDRVREEREKVATEGYVGSDGKLYTGEEATTRWDANKIEEIAKDRISAITGFNGAVNGVRSMTGAIVEAPIAVAVEVVSEVFEEVPSILTQMITAMGAGKYLKGLNKAVPDKYIKLSQDRIKDMAAKAGLTAGFAYDFAEGYGLGVSEGFNAAMATQYEVLYDKYKNSDVFKNYTKQLNQQVSDGILPEEQYNEKAQEYLKSLVETPENMEFIRGRAIEVGQEQGMFSASIQTMMGAMGFSSAADKLTLEKIFGKKAIKEISEVADGTVWKQIKSYAERTGKNFTTDVRELANSWLKEAFGEGVEEGAQTDHLNTQLLNLDPENTTGINRPKDAFASAMFGSVLGLESSSLMTTPMWAIDTSLNLAEAGIEIPYILRENYIQGAYKNSVTTPSGEVLEGEYIPARANSENSIATNAVVLFNPQVNNALTLNSDGTPVFTETEVIQVLDNVGITTDSSPRVYTSILNEIDDENYISPFEAKEVFADEDYVPTETEIDQFIGNTFGDSTIGQGIYDYVDPRQLTEEELDLIIGDIDVTLTAEQRAELIRQYTEPLDNQTRVQNFIDSLDKDGDPLPPEDFTYPPGSYQVTGQNPYYGDFYQKVGEDGELIEGTEYILQGEKYIRFLDTDGDNIPDFNDPDGDRVRVDPDPENANEARFDDDGVLEFADSDGNYPSDDTGDKDTDGDGVLDNNDNDDDNDGILDTDDKDDKDDKDDTPVTPTPATTDIPAWSRDKDYVLGDVVTENGILYRAIRPSNAGTAGLSNTYRWERVSTMPYYPDEPYTRGNIVESNGRYFKALTDIKKGTAGLGSSFWAEIPPTGNTQNFANLNPDTGADTDADPVGTGVDPVGTGLTPEQINQIVQGVLANLPASISTEDMQNAIATALANLPAGISTEDVQNAIATALNNADLSTLTTEDVQGIVNNAVEQITGDISDVQGTVDSITDQVTKAEEAGIARDEALEGAIDQVATDLGLTRTQLLEAIGETEQTLLSRLGEVETELSSDIQLVSEFVGKPAQQVTQDDIDFVADVIAQQEATTELAVLTEQQLQYDVNQDGVVDINDQVMLEQAMAGQDVALQGRFAPTGLYEQAAQTQQDIETAQELATQQAIQTQQQIQSTAAEQTRQRREDQFLRDLLLEEPQTATTQQMGVANIPYLYDISGQSVFAPTNRTQLFSPYGDSNVVPIAPQNQQNKPQLRPFAKGGLIRRNNALLRLIGED
jgi:hypothetical protein